MVGRQCEHLDEEQSNSWRSLECLLRAVDKWRNIYLRKANNWRQNKAGRPNAASLPVDAKKIDGFLLSHLPVKGSRASLRGAGLAWPTPTWAPCGRPTFEELRQGIETLWGHTGWRFRPGPEGWEYQRHHYHRPSSRFHSGGYIGEHQKLFQTPGTLRWKILRSRPALTYRLRSEWQRRAAHNNRGLWNVPDGTVLI